MKLLPLLTTAFFVHPNHGANVWKVRRLGQNHGLTGTFRFWISDASPAGQPLCITAEDGGMHNYGNLKLLPCDFDNYPPEQLWNLKPNGKIYSSLGSGSDKCMIVNHGRNLFDGVRLRLTHDCTDIPNSRLSLNKFVYNGTNIWLLDKFPTYCVTNRGAIAHVDDSIHAKPCQDGHRADFAWTYTTNRGDPPLDDDDGGDLLSFYADGGCMQPRNASTNDFTEIIMDECNLTSAWNVKRVNGVVLFRSRLDITKCMQAGSGGRVEHGTKLRLMPCDDTEDYQQFDWSDETPITLASRNDLCAEWRGVNVNVGSDPVIMKDCDKTVYEGWSGDSVD